MMKHFWPHGTKFQIPAPIGYLHFGIISNWARISAEEPRSVGPLQILSRVGSLPYIRSSLIKRLEIMYPKKPAERCPSCPGIFMQGKAPIFTTLRLQLEG